MSAIGVGGQAAVSLMPEVNGTLFCRDLSYFREKAMAPHSSTLAWKFPWVEEPGGLPSMKSDRVGHD